MHFEWTQRDRQWEAGWSHQAPSCCPSITTEQRVMRGSCPPCSQGGPSTQTPASQPHMGGTLGPDAHLGAPGTWAAWGNPPIWALWPWLSQPFDSCILDYSTTELGGLELSRVAECPLQVTPACHRAAHAQVGSQSLADPGSNSSSSSPPG